MPSALLIYKRSVGRARPADRGARARERFVVERARASVRSAYARVRALENVSLWLGVRTISFAFTIYLKQFSKNPVQSQTTECVSHGADKRVSGVATVGWSEVQQQCQ